MLPLQQLHFFADSSSGIGALGINGTEFLIQLISFLLVFLALKKWAFKPILKLLDERRKVIDSGITLGEKMQKEKAELELKVSEQMHKARQEADKIVSDAHVEAKEAVAAAELEAGNRADNILKDAKAQIEIATSNQRKKLEKEIVGLVSEVSEAIIGEKVDERKDSELIDKALRQRKTA